jgi:hypothetical protein
MYVRICTYIRTLHTRLCALRSIIEPYVHRLHHAHCTETDTPTTAALVDRRAVTDLELRPPPCMVHGMAHLLLTNWWASVEEGHDADDANDGHFRDLGGEPHQVYFSVWPRHGELFLLSRHGSGLPVPPLPLWDVGNHPSWRWSIDRGRERGERRAKAALELAGRAYTCMGAPRRAGRDREAGCDTDRVGAAGYRPGCLAGPACTSGRVSRGTGSRRCTLQYAASKGIGVVVGPWSIGGDKRWIGCMHAVASCDVVEKRGEGRTDGSTRVIRAWTNNSDRTTGRPVRTYRLAMLDWRDALLALCARGVGVPCRAVPSSRNFPACLCFTSPRKPMRLRLGYHVDSLQAL